MATTAIDSIRSPSIRRTSTTSGAQPEGEAPAARRTHSATMAQLSGVPAHLGIVQHSARLTTDGESSHSEGVQRDVAVLRAERGHRTQDAQ
eukprot:1051857-Pyramimonas_sp.AAC.1